MYDFHYNFVKKIFDAELLFTDTDSLTYEVKSEDVYKEFFKYKHLLNLSNFSKDTKLHDNQNEIAIGKRNQQIYWINIKNSFYSF